MRSTPCQSGEIQAIGWRKLGSDSIGKNVPEKRNSGVMPKRKMTLKRFGVRCVAENAAIGPAKAIPVRTATGIASTTSGEWAAPNATMTIVKTVAIIASRTAIQSEVAERDVARRRAASRTSRGTSAAS